MPGNRYDIDVNLNTEGVAQGETNIRSSLTRIANTVRGVNIGSGAGIGGNIAGGIFGGLVGGGLGAALGYRIADALTSAMVRVYDKMTELQRKAKEGAVKVAEEITRWVDSHRPTGTKVLFGGANIDSLKQQIAVQQLVVDQLNKRNANGEVITEWTSGVGTERAKLALLKQQLAEAKMAQADNQAELDAQSEATDLDYQTHKREGQQKAYTEKLEGEAPVDRIADIGDTLGTTRSQMAALSSKLDQSKQLNDLYKLLAEKAAGTYRPGVDYTKAANDATALEKQLGDEYMPSAALAKKDTKLTFERGLGQLKEMEQYADELQAKFRGAEADSIAALKVRMESMTIDQQIAAIDQQRANMQQDAADHSVGIQEQLKSLEELRGEKVLERAKQATRIQDEQFEASLERKNLEERLNAIYEERIRVAKIISDGSDPGHEAENKERLIALDRQGYDAAKEASEGRKIGADSRTAVGLGTHWWATSPLVGASADTAGAVLTEARRTNALLSQLVDFYKETTPGDTGGVLP